MHDLQFILQEAKSTDDTSRDPPEDILRDPNLLLLIFSNVASWNTAASKRIERTRIHKLHAVVDAGFDGESSKELYDLGRDGAMEDIELHDDLRKLGVVQLESNFLPSMSFRVS